jgi:hypothetical protein
LQVDFHHRCDTGDLFDRGRHPFVLQIVGSDLVRSARYDLLGGQDALLDQPTNAVMRDPSAVAASDRVSHSPFFSAER